LGAKADITMVSASLRPLGCIRFNWLHPPFDNAKMRQAVMLAVSQADYMTAFVGEPKLWNLCPGFFTCGGPMENKTGSEWLTGKRSSEKAKQLTREAGYKGKKMVLLEGVDQPLTHSEALVTPDILKKLDLNVEYVAADGGTVVTRRASKKPPA